MARTSKAAGYSVRKRTGTSRVYREGQFVGEHPESGFAVTVHGRGTCLAGTEVAAHAIGELLLDIEPHRRRFVLTEEEYLEHRAVLKESLDSLLAAYPYSAREAALVGASGLKHAETVAKGEANVKRGLMNVSPYRYVEWNPNPRKRPDLPALEEEAPRPAM